MSEMPVRSVYHFYFIYDGDDAKKIPDVDAGCDGKVDTAFHVFLGCFDDAVRLRRYDRSDVILHEGRIQPGSTESQGMIDLANLMRRKEELGIIHKLLKEGLGSEMFSLILLMQLLVRIFTRVRFLQRINPELRVDEDIPNRRSPPVPFHDQMSSYSYSL
jgi:hypothetical protein